MAAGGDEDDLEKEIFGDLFGDGDEPTAESLQAPVASPKFPASPGPLNEEDIFGDFDSGEEDALKEPPKRSHGEASSSSGAPPGAKAKRRKVGASGAAGSGDASKYFELEAEEAGDGSGDEDESMDIEGLIDDSGEPTGNKKFKLRSELQRAANSELEEVAADMASRGPETGARRVFGSSFLDRLQSKFDVIEQAGQDHPDHRPMAATDFANLPKEPTTTHIVPAPQDPKLWRCRSFADEKQLCISLMLKASLVMAKGLPVPIFSVFYSQHQRGYIYIEAMREAEVRDFCRGIRGISPWSIVVVPVSQMPQVVTSSVTDSGFKIFAQVGDYVRMKRKPYVGDMAQIDEINDEEYVVKLKPRIQYKLEQGNKADDKESRAASKRPASRWFNKTDLEAAGVMVNPQQRGTAKGILSFYMVGDEYYRDGFLYKRMKSTGLEMGEQVRPQEHELQDWSTAPGASEQTRPADDLDREDEDKKKMPPPSFIPAKAAPPSEPLVEGDVVIVNHGELRNLRGRVVKAIFKARTVTVRPFDVGVNQDLELAVSTLCKYFEVGDYVKVIGGERDGDAGYVMALNYSDVPSWHKDAIAMVLSSNITAEFEVRLDQLRLTAQRAEAVMELGDFEVGQMVYVQGRPDSRGLIVRLETTGAGSAELLMPRGERLPFALGELTPLPVAQTKRARFNFTVDRKGVKIVRGCIVKAPRGQQKAAPVQAEVLFIHNDTVFLQALGGLTGERAYLACAGKKTEFIYDKNESRELEKETGPDEVKLAHKEHIEAEKEEDREAEIARIQFGGVKMASATSWLKDWFKKMMGIEKDSEVSQIGAPIRITGGDYKGLRAEVRAFMGDKVRASLLCKPKLVVVPMRYVAPDELYKSRKRAPAPGTPPSDFGLKAPASPIADFAVGDEAKEPKDVPLDEDNSWDPDFLKPPPPKEPELPLQGDETPKAGGDSEDEAPLVAPPSPALSTASAVSRRKKRKAVLPGAEADKAKEATSSSWDWKSSWWEKQEEVVAVDGEGTPDAAGAWGEPIAQLGESPVSVGVSTPGAQSLAGSTPAGQGWTPESAEQTPGPASHITPMTPMPGAAGGAVTPMPPGASFGVFTPAPGLAGAVTPGFGGAKTPMEDKAKDDFGGATPFSSAVKGDQTPGGDATPFASSSAVKAGDETPAPALAAASSGDPGGGGAATPAESSQSAVKEGGETPGAETPGSPVKGEETPGGGDA